MMPPTNLPKLSAADLDDVTQMPTADLKKVTQMLAADLGRMTQMPAELDSNDVNGCPNKRNHRSANGYGLKLFQMCPLSFLFLTSLVLFLFRIRPYLYFSAKNEKNNFYVSTEPILFVLKFETFCFLPVQGLLPVVTGCTLMKIPWRCPHKKTQKIKKITPGNSLFASANPENPLRKN